MWHFCDALFVIMLIALVFVITGAKNMKKSFIRNIALSLAAVLSIGTMVGAIASAAKEVTRADAANASAKINYTQFKANTSGGSGSYSDPGGLGTWTWSGIAAVTDYNFEVSTTTPFVLTFTPSSTAGRLYNADFHFDVDKTVTFSDGSAGKWSGMASAACKITVDGASTYTYDAQQMSGFDFTKTYLTFTSGLPSVQTKFKGLPEATMWFTQSFTVTLDKQGGTGGDSTVEVSPGSAMPTISIPSRTGYNFLGYWLYEGGSGTKYYNSDGTSATTCDLSSTTTIYANWQLATYSISYNLAGGSVSSPNPTSYQYTTSSFTLNNPTKTGYTFLGWTGTGLSSPTKTVTISYGSTGNRSYTANWEANQYTVTLNPNNGSSGSFPTVTATYDSAMPSIPSGKRPTWQHHTFVGFFDTSSASGGTKYYNADFSSARTWNKISDSSLYARWTIDISVEVSMNSDYTGTWNNKKAWAVITPHDASTGSALSGTTIKYGTSSESCTDTNLDHFKYDAAGTYTVWFEVSKSGYTTYKSSTSFTIDKAPSVVNPKPSAILGLEYTAEAQNLVQAGTVDYGTMRYAVSDTLAVPSDDKFSTSIPTGLLVGTYYVFYKSTGDSNHYPYDSILADAITVQIARVDRTEVENLNAEVEDYLDTIETRFPSIAATLEAVREEVYQDAIVEDNITAEGVAGNVVKLQDALSVAKVAVTEELIKAIEDVVYPDSIAAILEAKNYYENVLTSDERDMVDPDLVTLLYADYDLWTTVKGLVDLIKNIPEPAESKDYYDKVDAAEEYYNGLTAEQLKLFQDATDKNWEKELLDHIAAREVIELIDNIDKVRYNHGKDDSLADIVAAEEGYKELSDEQKAMVDKVNYDTLVHDRKVYDDADNAVKLIENIGTVEHTEECKGKLDAARDAYDKLTDEEKALVDGYNSSYKVLEDDEHVYEALVLIDEIGEVGYDHESEERIAKAREYYDSLTEDQKEQLGEVPFNSLTKAETDYAEAKHIATVWMIVLYVLAGLLIIGGIFFIIFLLLKRRKEDDENGNPSGGVKKPVKAMSVTGFLPVVGLVSHWVDSQYIALYVLLGVAVLIWIAVLVLALMKKKGVAMFASVATETSSSSQAMPPLSHSEEGETYTDEKGNTFEIRYIKSFTAKLIQSSDEAKKYYEELKNEVLSYKGTSSRVSWHYDSINSGREIVLKFAVRGKTLCVYYPLDLEKVDSKYKVEKAEIKRFESVPCLYRIKNDRRLGYAKELIAEVCKKLGLKKGEAQHKVYVLPYEENKPLVARGLIKEQKVQISKPAAPVVLEKKVNADGDEIVVEKDASGNIFEIRFIKSFTAKLSQASDEVKDYYDALKNYALSYKGTSSRVSWHYDSINLGRTQVLKFSIRGKTLCVYYALEVDQVDEKYKVEKVESKKFNEVPCLYRIRNERRFQYAKELIDILMKKTKVEKGKEHKEDYHLPYESTEALLSKGLIKEVKTSVKSSSSVKHVASVSAEEADSLMSDEVAERMIEEDKESKVHQGKRGIINLDDLEANFNDGDTITLEALIEKKLVAKDVGRVKLLARGKLDKKFHVDLQDYSLQAVKMVLLVGGTVQKAK